MLAPKTSILVHCVRSNNRSDELIPLDEVISTDGDDLDDDERAALHRSIDESIEDEEAGNVEDLSKIIAELRAQL